MMSVKTITDIRVTGGGAAVIGDREVFICVPAAAEQGYGGI